MSLNMVQPIQCPAQLDSCAGQTLVPSRSQTVCKQVAECALVSRGLRLLPITCMSLTTVHAVLRSLSNTQNNF